MPRLGQQIENLKKQLDDARAIIEWQQNKINDLNRQLQEQIANSPMYQAQVNLAELAELKLQAAQETIAHQAETIKRLSENNTERITEQITAVPEAHKRGARRKADETTRQIIHELRKHGSSLQTIADAVSMSKTQVHAILKEPEKPGRWYTVRDGSRFYFIGYSEAARSRAKIYYEIRSTEP